MELIHTSVTLIGGKEVKVGQVWQQPASGFFLHVGAVCTGVKPDRFKGRVLLGSTEVLQTTTEYGNIDAAQRQAEALLIARVARLLSTDGDT